MGYLNLFRPDVRLLTLPFGGFLGDTSDDNCSVLVKEVINSLRRGEADLAIFEPLNTNSALYRCVRSSPAWFCRDYLGTSQVHRSMALFESAEAFHQSLSTKVRKNLKWQAKKIVADYCGEVRLSSHRAPSELEVVFTDVEEIAKKTYQRGLGVGFSDNAENRARLRLEADKGWLHAHILYLGDRPSAFWLSTAYKGTLHSNFMGYDPGFAKHSPGMYLVIRVIEELCTPNGTNKLEQVDFGLGDAQYKQVLASSSWQEAELYIFSPSLKGVTLNFLRTSLGLLNRTVRRILDKTKLLPRIKNLWRKSARKTAS